MEELNKSIQEILPILLKTAEIVQEGVLYIKAEGHIIAFNTQLAEELGYSKENFKPKTIFEVNPMMSILSWKRLWKQLLKEKKIEIETEQITADDSIYPVKMRGMLLDIGGELICMATLENLMASNRFKDLLNLTSRIGGIASFEWDLVQNEFICSDEMYHMMGIPTNQKITKDFLKSIIERDLSRENLELFKRELDFAIKKGKIVELELAFKFKGTYENYALNLHPAWLEDQTIKIYGTIQNLTKVTKRTDDMYLTKFCMDFARDMIYWVDASGNIFYVNQTACEKLGYSSEELCRKNVKDISPYSTVDLKEHWEELKTQKSLEFESVHLSKNGSEIPVSIIANYIHYQGKEFNCGFVRDLSAKLRQDRLITMAKHSLDHSLDMIFWSDQDGSFRYFNQAFEEKTGYSKDEIQKMKIFDFFFNYSPESFQLNWEALEQEKVLDGLDQELRLKGGGVMPTAMSVKMVSFENEKYLTTVLRDVTELKKKENLILSQLREIERLQEATQAENIDLKNEIDLEFNFDNIISVDPNYKKVLQQVEQVAETDATVLILGETGTGKELLARAIHRLSDRSKASMIKINCGALPENLIESELFGHEKGAFTGAHQQKIGKFERADQGTIFLDEIGELPLELQTKLLRVLQENEIERVGGVKLISIDVRVIAATNRNLEQLVAEGRFRQDLYYRLNVFPIYNIPLRERREDIPILVKYFVEKYSKKINKPITEVSSSGLKKLLTYNFQGNVRELENIVERAIILSNGKVLNFNNLNITKRTRAASNKFLSMEEMQKKHIINALKRTNGKVSGDGGAALLLGMNNKTLSSRMRKLGISKHDYIKN